MYRETLQHARSLTTYLVPRSTVQQEPSLTVQRARSLTLRTATGSDLPGVLALLAETAGWLNSRGIRQWPLGGFPAARIEPLIDAGTLYILDDESGEHGEGGSTPAATLALDDNADPEFWERRDRPETGLYVHKLAVKRAFSGNGLGETLLDWATLRVAAAGLRWLRLDCSKDNPALQGYYRKIGFQHVRTVDLSHRASGALFQRPADLTSPAVPSVGGRYLPVPRPA